MEVRFTLTGEDYWNLTRYNFSRNRTLVSTGISLVIVICLLVLYVLVSPPSKVLSNLLTTVLPLFALLLLVVLLRWRAGRIRRSRSRWKPELQGEQIISISPEGLHYRTSLTNSEISWDAIKTITADRYGLYFIRLSDRLVAHAIPRRAFAAPQEAEAFLAQAQSYWRNRHSIR